LTYTLKYCLNIFIFQTKLSECQELQRIAEESRNRIKYVQEACLEQTDKLQIGLARKHQQEVSSNLVMLLLRLNVGGSLIAAFFFSTWSLGKFLYRQFTVAEWLTHLAAMLEVDIYEIYFLESIQSLAQRDSK